jgi:hypothetical protein
LAAADGLNVLGADVFTQPGGAPSGSPPLLQHTTRLTSGGGGSSGAGPVAGCRSVTPPKPRRGRFPRGSLLAVASLHRVKAQPILFLRLNHLARVRVRWHGGSVSHRLRACRVYSLALPRHAGRMTIEARVAGGLERRVFRVR